jgi:ATP-dependent DNA ligase
VSAWPFDPPVTPMEARVHQDLPPEGKWAYEPKWDGFRMLAWAGREPRLDSRKQRPLLRYFPELEPALAGLPDGAVVDGEVVVIQDGRLAFDTLQQRIHPAASRIAKLSQETPAALVAFDLLAVDGDDLRGAAFTERRARLEELAADLPDPWHLTPSTSDRAVAARWFDAFEAAGCDGIVAKRLDGGYLPGERAMAKVKHRRTADCVVGGYRLHKEGDRVGSLLLGLYRGGQLHFIGHCSGFSDGERKALLERLRPLEDPADGGGFGQGVRRPGEPSRWSGDKDLSWVGLRPELVCEVSYDQLTADRFRHATRFERWRPDKDPADCTFAQLEPPAFGPQRPSFGDVVVD